MYKKINFLKRIDMKILIMLLILFSITTIIIRIVNTNNIRRLYEGNFTERVLLTNALMTTIIDSEDVNYFVKLINNQDNDFRQKQVQFYHDRKELRELRNKGVSEENQRELLEKLTLFNNELLAFKTEKYWDNVNKLQYLKEVSHSSYLYVMADTGLVTNDGEALYIFIFDADDDATAYGDMHIDDSLYTDGLGTSDTSLDSIKTVYATKKQMDWVEYYNDVYGELYYAYSPIFDSNGEVIAVFGSDLDLGSMNKSIIASSHLFNAIFILSFIAIILIIFIFISRNITKPIASLTNTAYELSEGDVYASISEVALKQGGEIGMLANAIKDMSFTYQEMISSTKKLFGAANIGRLNIRNDASKFKGDIQNVIKQINDTLDATMLYLNSIPEGIFIMSKDFEIYFRNRHFINCFGIMTASEFIMNLFPESKQNKSDSQNHLEFLKKQISGVLNHQNNSTTVWINDLCFSVIFKEIILNNTNENSILVITIDITDLIKEKENAQAAAQAKSSFLSRMSHEMRTPMNAIIGMTKIAKDSDDINKLKYCLSTIGASSEHLLGIINDVLDMSKIEAGKFELENVPMNIEKILMKVCNIISDSIQKKNQKFNVILAKNMNLNYIGDDLRLTQVITNLLSNAVKFTPENGKITLTIEKIGTQNNMDTLRFAITDTGIGMTNDQIARLFNIFEQADGSISRKYGGTGLGLSISKNIIEKMGGRIWVESEHNKGSTFFFDVTLECTSHQETIIFDGIRPEDIRLLIIESDYTIRNHFLSIIKNFGIFADSATNANEAIDLVEASYNTNHTYDIIFLANDIPEVNGLDIAEQLNNKIDKNTVIIITSFLEWNRIEKQAHKNNITRYITKPLFPSSILDAINDVIGKNLKSFDIKAEKTNEMPDLSNVSIILAEDVDINREIFLTLLEDTHISVDIAENGSFAVSKFKENPDKYDLIIMDIQMPEMDGYQATRIIRGMDIPKAKTIPIIAMTANAFKEDIERCLECGMNDHLPKPIDEKSVIEKIIYYSKINKK